ncbi:hypothetical protein QRX60_43715 [Amycolatopsis mongoliensis]|uniref:Uncharacterized protein n=1 Tax=Amycolatopsis mongoliensis TaxID=715475 RepID=A0A9Y2JP10_9PSEU|nr:hypothetical protein [Amycolatopsis sp. 4-36]WIY00892.1 hypothetical protein QRX60_43715 [Amycolatopsis sp. 4-36]
MPGNARPNRLVLGNDFYRFPHAARTERFADIEAQQTGVGQTDFTEQTFTVRRQRRGPRSASWSLQTGNSQATLENVIAAGVSWRA